jgi:hypothetical protein
MQISFSDLSYVLLLFQRGVMSNIIVVTIKTSDMLPCQRGPMAIYLTSEILVELFVRG